MPTFDGPNTTITLDSGVTSVSVAGLYSDWKEWVRISDNAKFPQAFRVIGGDPLGGGISAGSYFFLQNQKGWRIRPPEEDISLELVGNLFAEDPGAGLLIPTIGNFNTFVRVSTSSLTQVVESTDASALTADLVVINRGVQRSSLSIPHTEDLP